MKKYIGKVHARGPNAVSFNKSVALDVLQSPRTASVVALFGRASIIKNINITKSLLIKAMSVFSISFW